MMLWSPEEVIESYRLPASIGNGASSSDENVD